MRSRQQLRRRQTNASTLRQHEHYVSEKGSTPLLLCSFSSRCIYMSSIRVWSIYPRAMIARSIFKTWSVGRLLWHSAILTRQGAIHTLTWSPPGAEVISPPYLHLYHFPLSFSGPLLLPNLCTKSLCSFLVTLEPILSPPVPLYVKGYQMNSGTQDLIILYCKLQTSSSVSCWIGVPSALFFMFTIARGCFLKCVFIVFATPVMTLFLPKT